jgi:small subunit ribosomal protein S20
MPNTKSAEQRVRNSARKHLYNSRAKSRVKTLEKSYLELIKSGKNEDAAAALRKASSALDKAAKVGAIHAGKADRKKSRLAIVLGKAVAAKAAQPKTA